jgi:hypothetical protein
MSPLKKLCKPERRKLSKTARYCLPRSIGLKYLQTTTFHLFDAMARWVQQ